MAWKPWNFTTVSCLGCWLHIDAKLLYTALSMTGYCAMCFCCRYREKIYCFCSEDAKEKFSTNPLEFISGSDQFKVLIHIDFCCTKPLLPLGLYILWFTWHVTTFMSCMVSHNDWIKGQEARWSGQIAYNFDPVTGVGTEGIGVPPPPSCLRGATCFVVAKHQSTEERTSSLSLSAAMDAIYSAAHSLSCTDPHTNHSTGVLHLKELPYCCSMAEPFLKWSKLLRCQVPLHTWLVSLKQIHTVKCTY